MKVLKMIRVGLKSTSVLRLVTYVPCACTRHLAKLVWCRRRQGMKRRDSRQYEPRWSCINLMYLVSCREKLVRFEVSGDDSVGKE